jgi:very-short-patch-repair endonuclease
VFLLPSSAGEMSRSDRGASVKTSDGILRLVRLTSMTNLTDHARAMRKAMPGAERRFWCAVKNRQVAGFRFQRQAIIGPFIVDFLCRERLVIVEIDGATHGDDDAIAYDQRRDAVLRERGYTVFRTSNHDVYSNLTGVLDSLLDVLNARPALWRKRLR